MVIIDSKSNLNELKHKKFFIIKYNDELDEILYEIKSNTDAQIYTKPILLLNDTSIKIDDYYVQAVDKVIDLDYINNKDYLSDELIQKINKKAILLKDIKNNEISFKILRFLFTRDDVLTPYPNINNKYGYSYPKIDYFFGKNNTKDGIFDILDFLTQHKLIEPIFYDKAHFCPECYSAFLNFKEVCPRCLNANIKSEDLIHHFECAYVGLESEFKQGNKLICPKCDKELFHIGVDYDKPSSVYQCHKCQYEFQEPLVQANCFNCKNIFDVDNLILREISEYKNTILTENSALFGFENIFNNMLNENIDILPLQIFKKFVDIEVKRANRYKKTVSSLVCLNLENVNQIYKTANDIMTLKNIFSDLVDIIRNFLRTTDLITSFNDIKYYILLVETPQNGATIAMNRLKKEIEELLKFNLKKDYEIIYQITNIDLDSTLNEVIKSIK